MQQAQRYHQRCLECVRDHLSVEPGIELEDEEDDSDGVTNQYDFDDVSSILPIPQDWRLSA